jgi:hypothetical protein
VIYSVERVVQCTCTYIIHNVKLKSIYQVHQLLNGVIIWTINRMLNGISTTLRYGSGIKLLIVVQIETKF